VKILYTAILDTEGQRARTVQVDNREVAFSHMVLQHWLDVTEREAREEMMKDFPEDKEALEFPCPRAEDWTEMGRSIHVLDLGPGLGTQNCEVVTFEPKLQGPNVTFIIWRTY
jgi:hypothetical protein